MNQSIQVKCDSLQWERTKPDGPKPPSYNLKFDEEGRLQLAKAEMS